MRRETKSGAPRGVLADQGATAKADVVGTPRPYAKDRARGVDIHDRRVLLRHYFLTVFEVVLRHRLPDGGWSPEITRINVDRDDSVAALVYEARTKFLYFTKQFRYSTYDYDNEYAPNNGWLIELVAGRAKIRSADSELESPDAAMRREIKEETGFDVTALEPISAFFLSPGSSSEKLHLFFAAVVEPEGGREKARGGDFDEFIILERMTPETFLKSVENGAMRDAKTICGAEWLRRNAHRL